jgi:N-acetylglucosamine malate deacetylase 1
MITKVKTALILAPHTDDAEIGAGGLIARLVEQGTNITYVTFSHCEESLKENLPKDTLVREAREAAQSLGVQASSINFLGLKVRRFEEYRQQILQYLIDLKRGHGVFDLVLTPCSQDIHQDHKVVTRECVRAFKDSTILGYELPWNTLSFTPTLLVSMSEVHLKKKTEAVMRFKSQSHRYYMREEFVRSSAVFRGTSISESFAEAYEVIRWVIR